MREEFFVCDKCKLKERFNKTKGVVLFTHDDEYAFDLCRKCFREFRRWVKCQVKNTY